VVEICQDSFHPYLHNFLLGAILIFENRSLSVHEVGGQDRCYRNINPYTISIKERRFQDGIMVFRTLPVTIHHLLCCPVSGDAKYAVLSTYLNAVSPVSCPGSALKYNTIAPSPQSSTNYHLINLHLTKCNFSKCTSPLNKTNISKCEGRKSENE
jgi:hypothetical protein